MGSVVQRGTRAKPRFYIKYKERDGQYVMRAAKGASSRPEAQRLLNAAELRVSEGRVGIEPIVEPTPEERARATITVEKLGEKFVAEYTSPKLKDVQAYRDEAKSLLNRVYPTLGTRAAASVTSLDIERLRDQLLDEKYAGASVIGTLAKISRMYVWGRKQRWIDCGNPASGVERPAAVESLDYFSKLEVASLLEYAARNNLSLWPLVATGVYAGLRKGELFGLQWTAVHLDGTPRIDVVRSYRGLPKSKKKRHVPLHPELARILRLWRDQKVASDENLVFPTPRGKMGRGDEDYGLPELLKAAECHVPAKPWHALRHSFASHFIMNGGNILTLQRLLGHSDIKQTMRYSHLAPDFMTAEVARVSFVVSMAGVTPIEAAVAP